MRGDCPAIEYFARGLFKHRLNFNETKPSVDLVDFAVRAQIRILSVFSKAFLRKNKVAILHCHFQQEHRNFRPFHWSRRQSFPPHFTIFQRYLWPHRFSCPQRCGGRYTHAANAKQRVKWEVQKSAGCEEIFHFPMLDAILSGRLSSLNLTFCREEVSCLEQSLGGKILAIDKPSTLSTFFADERPLSLPPHRLFPPRVSMAMKRNSVGKRRKIQRHRKFMSSTTMER